ncbi:uncharacterized protein BXZ73DRAFT_101037 [Epithele typhae]|uniref:uncharacterized protein n=1 Tax=Epithele typhae TaxID=378194 RepID=UPI002007322D|nr:uncharacterized protein BXZ73DRAFT_101037 [Epithele typhae]KAH9933654.1 hypothetical protein BXZ73DRAFT_101037 [Epithele typhae]
MATNASTGSASAHTELPSLAPTFGALLIGSCISVVLYGWSLHQGFEYARTNHGDSAKLRVLVYSILIASTAQTALMVHALYYYLITHYAQPQALSEAIWSLNLTPMFAALITVGSQSFFIVRVSLISYKYAVAGVTAALLILAKLACGLAFAAKGFITGSTSFFLHNVLLFQLALGFATLANIILSGSLLTVLLRGRPGASRSDSSIEESIGSQWIVVWLLNPGIFILACDALALILVCRSTRCDGVTHTDRLSIAVTRRPSTLYWLMFYMITSPLDVITLLSVLNTRKISATRAMFFLDPGGFNRNAIARADRQAQLERYNVPQLPEELHTPAMIDVKVDTEVERALSETLGVELPRSMKRKYNNALRPSPV